MPKLKVSKKDVKIKIGLTTVEPSTQSKIITPDIVDKTVLPDDGIFALSRVTVEAVTSKIDNNIKPENIKGGVKILGVEGNIEEVFFDSYYGFGYKKEFVCEKGYVVSNIFRSCSHLEKISFPKCEFSFPNNTASDFCSYNSALKEIYAPLAKSFGHYVFRGNTALEKVQLGSIGHPVNSIAVYTFSKCTSPFILTIFVDDNATIPLDGSPFEAKNATIIYRSATTGEVLTV